MVLILQVVTPMKTDKQIENICNEHVLMRYLNYLEKYAEVYM